MKYVKKAVKHFSWSDGQKMTKTQNNIDKK